jgi:hypothetical protein
MEPCTAVVGRDHYRHPERTKLLDEQQLGLGAGTEQNLQPVSRFEAAGKEEQRRCSDSATTEQNVLIVQLRSGSAQWPKHVEFVACTRAT